MGKYIKLRRMIEIGIFVISLIVVDGLLMKNVSNAAEEELSQHLAKICSQERGEGTDWGKLEQECLKLLEEYDLPEDKGNIYATIALIYSKSGFSRKDIQVPKTIEYCKKALQYPLEVVTECNVYSEWVDALIAKSNLAGERFVGERQEIVILCLKGLKLALDNKAPKDRQPPPAVGRYTITPDDSDYQKYMEKYKEGLAARKKWDFENKLYRQRKALTGRIVLLYSFPPYATDELSYFAEQFLKSNNDVIKELIAEVNRGKK